MKEKSTHVPSGGKSERRTPEVALDLAVPKTGPTDPWGPGAINELRLELAHLRSVLNSEPVDSEQAFGSLDFEILLLTLRSASKELRKRWKLAAAIVALTTAVGLTHYLATPNVYQATASLQILRLPSFSLERDNDWLRPQTVQSSDHPYLLSEHAVIRSREVAERVVRSLGLVSEGLGETTLAATGGAPAPVSPLDGRVTNAAENLRRSLRVVPIRNTYLVQVIYADRDPVRAAKIVNEVADTYVGLRLENENYAAERAQSFLLSQIESIKRDIVDRENQLATQRRQADLLLDEKSDLTLSRLQAVNSQYLEAIAERIDREVAYRYALNSSNESLVGELEDPGLKELEKKQMELEREYATKLNTYRPDWPAMTELRAQINAGRAHLARAKTEVAAKHRSLAHSEFQNAARSERDLQDEIRRIEDENQEVSSAAITYEQLMMETEGRRQLLKDLLTKQTEMEMSSRFTERLSSEVKILDRALVPKGAVSPNLSKDLTIGAGSGTLIVALLLFFAIKVNLTISTPEQAQEILQAATLAVIPDVSGKKDTSLRSANIELCPHTDPRSAVSECYRSLRASLWLSTAGDLDVVAITSATPAEGKTSTLVNLGITIAQLGRRVLLVDADLRKPRLHSIFRLSNRRGLVTYLANGEGKHVLQWTQIDNLCVCTSGPIPPNPSELLASDRMKAFLDSVSEHFDTILVDTPPALDLSDAVTIGSVVDGVVLCVRSGRLHPREARSCRDRLRLAGARIVGTVLNAEATHASRYGKYYSEGRYGYGHARANQKPASS